MTHEIERAGGSGSGADARAVLVTGAASGIGHATALHLARSGIVTFATVRRTEHVERLHELGEPDLVPVCPLDLTRPEHVPAVAESVRDELDRRGIEGLYAIVNNAGGGGIAPIELMDVEGFRAEIETRLVGPVALLQAFLPQIRQARGRIVWIATPSLIPIPNVAAIHAADYAVNCLARTLQIELKPWGVRCVFVRCGGIRTPSVHRSWDDLDRDLQRWPPDVLAAYREALDGQRRDLEEFDRKRTPPEAVAEVVHTALTAARPRGRYTIGHMARAAAFLELFPQGVVDRIMAGRS